MFFGVLMGKIFGGLFRMCNSSHELLSQFNESIATRVFVCCDEAGFFSGFRGEWIPAPLPVPHPPKEALILLCEHEQAAGPESPNGGAESRSLSLL